MKILFARHGNTFEKSETPRWVGLHEDLPLTQEGERQALAVAEAFERVGIAPTRVFCSNLRRTKRFAEIIVNRLRLSVVPVIDSRLNEIDYGSWGGLSKEEIVERFGLAVFEAWEVRGEWPAGCGWGGSREATQSEMGSFLREMMALDGETPLVITSNGRLRALGELVAPSEHPSGRKVRPGALCAIDGDAVESCRLRFWNKSPEALENSDLS